MDKQPKKLTKKPAETIKLKCAISNDAAPEIENPKVCFDEPELNTALKFVREMESVENIRPKHLKSSTDLKIAKNLLDERATKQLNHPHHQKLYKNLMPLCTKRQPQVLPQISRDYQVIKDQEPVLSDFYTPKVLPEYSFRVPSQTAPRNLYRQFDGFKLYRTMRNWN
ncbi:hypothetical protein PPYR_12994 [Photinus pyralis]|uniref:Protein phosphatase 1 regulatory subunit 35 C-terminal domain-containing protein n=1 Tax=Photinus pyralis TaxID=7054 RepID=A0A1Y1K406_PHOPY|nr:uncharacterized protein LOC116179000 [Photinus pyralis]KAB0793374.1 hypothetical protein PPYR_12994 [Photinus pyralis]